DELVLLEEALDGGVLLPHLLAGLDGNGQRRAAVELPAHDGGGDERGAPVDHEEIEAAKIREVGGAGLVTYGVVLLCAVVGVAKVVDGETVTVALAPGETRHVGLPVRVVGGLERAPPEEDRPEGHRPDHEREAEGTQPDEDDHRADKKDTGE